MKITEYIRIKENIDVKYIFTKINRYFIGIGNLHDDV